MASGIHFPTLSLVTAVNMASEHLTAFSRITEKFLFFSVGRSSQPKLRKSWAIKILIYVLITFKFLHFVKIDNQDVVQQVRHGNYLVGLTVQIDLITVPIVLGAVEFTLLLSYHVHLLRNRSRTLQLMTQVVSEYFGSMSKDRQQLLLTVARRLMVTTLGFVLFVNGYAACTIVATHEMTLFVVAQLIAVTTTMIYFSVDVLMICFAIAVCMGMCCAYVSRELTNVCESTHIEQTLRNFNAASARIHTLNLYWKNVNFLFVIVTATITTIFLSLTVLYDNLPTVVTVGYIAVIIAFSAMYTSIMLSAAYVHFKVKNSYKDLLRLLSTSQLNPSQGVQFRFKLNNVLKKFEHLKVFTLADVAPITFDNYREVSNATIVQVTQLQFAVGRESRRVVLVEHQTRFVAPNCSLVTAFSNRSTVNCYSNMCKLD